MKTENHSSKFKTFESYAIILRFKFWFFAFCLSIPMSFVGVASAEISLEQLDPTNLLVAVFAETSQDANMPDVPMQLVKIRQRRQDTQAGSIAPVSFADKASCRSERPVLRSSSSATAEDGSKGYLITQRPNPSALPQDDGKKRCQLSQGSLGTPFCNTLQNADPFISAANPGSRLGRQLWRAKITVPESEEDEGSRNELQRIIEQIRSVEFKPQNKTPEPVIVAELVSTIEPNETLSGLPAIGRKITALSDTEAPEEPEEKQIESKLPYEPITSQTLQMLEKLLQHPDQMDNPLEMGEVLFLSGRLKEAGVFYQEALNRGGADDVSSAQDRAWILFQVGNCLRDRDRPTAKKMYRQLITEFPNSLWADSAKAQDKLIDWYQKDKPRTLMNGKK